MTCSQIHSLVSQEGSVLITKHKGLEPPEMVVSAFLLLKTGSQADHKPYDNQAA
jgi:hypothetical protein